jgi:hypothetical protein
MTTYKIIRHFFNTNRKITIHTRMSLEEAQAYCHDPETSSSTCTLATARARTRKHGKWFDGYTEEK